MRPIVQRILNSITAPAYVRNGRLDLLAGNTLGLALYAPVFEDPSGTTNMARFIFLHPGASEFFPDWERIANDAVAILFMFDLTRKSTLNSIKEWYRQARGFNKVSFSISPVGIWGMCGR